MHCMSPTACLVVGLATIATVPGPVLAQGGSPFTCPVDCASTKAMGTVTVDGPEPKATKSHLLVKRSKKVGAMWVTLKCTNCKAGDSLSLKLATAKDPLPASRDDFFGEKTVTYVDVPELGVAKADTCGMVCANPVTSQYPLYGALIEVGCHRKAGNLFGAASEVPCQYQYAFGYALMPDATPAPATAAPTPISAPVAAPPSPVAVGETPTSPPSQAIQTTFQCPRECSATSPKGTVTTDGPRHNAAKSHVIAIGKPITALWVTVKCTNCAGNQPTTSFKVETASVAGGEFGKNIPELESQKSMCGMTCANPVKAQYPLHGARLTVKCNKGWLGAFSGAPCHYEYSFGYELVMATPAPTPELKPTAEPTEAPEDSRPAWPREEDAIDNNDSRPTTPNNGTPSQEKSREINNDLSTNTKSGSGGWDPAMIAILSVCIFLLLCCVSFVGQVFTSRQSGGGDEAWDAEDPRFEDDEFADEGLDDEQMWEEDVLGDDFDDY